MSLFLSRSVTLDGSGDGLIRFDQVGPFDRWDIERISVTITGGLASNTGGEARIYRNSTDAPNFIDGTNSPWNDVYSGAFTLMPAEVLLVNFDSCGAGQVATVTVQGQRSRVR